MLDLTHPSPTRLRCDTCGRFCSIEHGATIGHEYGDYGQIYSSDVECPRCTHDRRVTVTR